MWEFQADERPPWRPLTSEDPDPVERSPVLGVEDAVFYNVIAELPGEGDSRLLEDDLSLKVRDILLKYPN